MKAVTRKKSVITTTEQMLKIWTAIKVTQLKINNQPSEIEEVMILLGLFFKTLVPVEKLKSFSFYDLTELLKIVYQDDDANWYYEYFSRMPHQSDRQPIFLNLFQITPNKLKSLIKFALSEVLYNQHAELKDIEIFIYNYLYKLDIYTKKFVKHVLLYKQLRHEEVTAANGLIMLWSVKLRNEYDEYLNNIFRTPLTAKINRFSTPL